MTIIAGEELGDGCIGERKELEVTPRRVSCLLVCLLVSFNLSIEGWISRVALHSRFLQLSVCL